MTQADVAALTLKTVETISNFERGKTVPSVATLYRLADAMNVSVRDIFDNAPPVAPVDPEVTMIANKCRVMKPDDQALFAAIADLLAARSRD